MTDDKEFYEKTLEARWVVDSETGKRYLLDLKTGEILINFDEFQEGKKNDRN